MLKKNLQNTIFKIFVWNANISNPDHSESSILQNTSNHKMFKKKVIMIEEKQKILHS